MYTKVQFGKDLKQKVLEKKNVEAIGNWIYKIYVNWEDIHDNNFINLLLHLSTMELGPEFAFSYEELNQIADDLISGKDVQLQVID